MRAIVLFLLTLLLAVPSAAMADGHKGTSPDDRGYHQGQQGNTPLTSAAQVRDARDDTPVNLEGRIVRHLRKDKFMFEDASGSVVVEIDMKELRGRELLPGTPVRIHGEVDRKRGKDNEIDVKWLEFANGSR